MRSSAVTSSKTEVAVDKKQSEQKSETESSSKEE